MAGHNDAFPEVADLLGSAELDALLSGIPLAELSGHGLPLWGDGALLGVPAQPSSSTGPSQQGASTSTDTGPQQARRSRGRPPKPTEQLSAKQLRVREQNRKYEERQKQKRAEIEEQLDQAAAALEHERAQQEGVRATATSYERMLAYAEEMLGALSVARQDGPVPGIVVPPDMAQVIQQERVLEEYRKEDLLRYTPGGHTEHLDEAGYATKPPPFQAVAKDWTDVVMGMQRALEECRLGSTSLDGGSCSSTGGDGTEPAGPAGAGLPAFHARKSAPGEVLELGNGLAGKEGVAAVVPEGSRSPPAGSESPAGGATASRSSSTAAGAAQPAAPADIKPDPSNSGGDRCAGERLEGAAAGDGDQAFRPLQVLLNHLKGNHIHSIDDLDQALGGAGLEVLDGADTYRFPRHHLRHLYRLLERVGLLAWQQAILFPDNADKLFAYRLDTGEEVCDEQELPRWQQVVRELRLRREQLERVVGLHRTYLATVAPPLAQRRAALRRLQEIKAAMQPGGSQADLMQQSLLVAECGGALQRSSQALQAAVTEMASRLFNYLDFPLQECKLAILSYPYFPQVHLIGMAAALELGLEADLQMVGGLQAAAPLLDARPLPAAAAAAEHAAHD